MTALVCGSFAYDTIMVFPERFRDHILPDKVHMLNVAFLVPDMRREFGGCAGNIAYNLNLLGGDGYAMGTVGEDFGAYANWMDQQGISRKYLKQVPGTYTAQAYITTDTEDNQITAFHPGAMNSAHLNEIPVGDGISLGLVSPDGRDGMIQHAEQFAAAGIPFMFDPGQGLPMFNGEALRRFIDQATWVAVNDYESSLIQDRTGWSEAEIGKHVDALIVTRGAKGSDIFTDGKTIHIPTATPEAIEDPTGCGDAYRAGLLYGLMKEMDWETTGRIASLMGAIKIAHKGTQNHAFTREDFSARFRDAFDREI